MAGFAAAIRKFVGKTQARLDSTRRAVIIKLFNSVVEDTPVLTGRLRGNWICTIGNPGDGFSHNTDVTGEQIKAVIQKMADQSTMKDIVFFRNNLPYAYRIEYEGWSKSKAPAGMVRRNVTRFQRLVNEAVSKGAPL